MMKKDAILTVLFEMSLESTRRRSVAGHDDVVRWDAAADKTTTHEATGCRPI